MSRSDYSIRNIATSLLSTISNILLGFICQRYFVSQLGSVNLGINGLFTNIISFLSIAELGIGPAIVFNMYKPIKENDTEKIKSLMDFYKKSYRVIAMLIFAIGIIISFFLPAIIGENNIEIIGNSINIYYIFLLFLIDTVASYIMTYKRSILYANQKNYNVTLIHTFSVIIMYILQIIILILFKDFYLYLIIKIICRIIENILINKKANKCYPYILEKNAKKIDNATSKDIKQRVKASIFHNIGGYIVLSTDNLIISRFIGLAEVGLYSNYLLIINALNSIISQIFSSITASVGNLLIEKNHKKNKKVFDNVNCINFWIYCIASCGLYTCVQPFITIWLGDKYLFANSIVIVITINFFFQGMRQTMQVFAQAGGICYENRLVPIFEAFLNIVFSILFVKLIGLAGVFVGTIISSFAVHFYSYPKYVYSQLFKRNRNEYIIQFIKKVFIFILILLINVVIIRNINLQNIYFTLIVNGLISVTISASILYILYRKSDEYKYFINLISKIISKFKKINI